MSSHSDKAKQEEYIELLDHGYIVRKGLVTEVCHPYASRKGQYTREHRKRVTRKSLKYIQKAKRLRKKTKEKKRQKRKKEKTPEVELVSCSSIQEPPQLLQQPCHSSTTSAPLTDSSMIIDLSVKGESATQPEPVSTEPMQTEFETPQSLNEAIESANTFHNIIDPEPEVSVPEWKFETMTHLNAADTKDGDMVDVVRKILWEITSAYYCRGLLSEEDVGDSPAVRLEPEPTNLADQNAIKLLFQAKNGEWVHGGYVPREETQRVRDLGDTIIGARVAFWRNRGCWRCPYVQLQYRARVKRVAATNQTLLTPSIVTEKSWVDIQSRKYKVNKHVYGKWLVFVKKEELDSLWHRVAYNVENGCLGKGCTQAKCSTARENYQCTDSREGVIVVYTTKSAANHVGFKLSKLTRIMKIHYKTEAATLAGIYAGDPGCIIKTIRNYAGIPRLNNKKVKS